MPRALPSFDGAISGIQKFVLRYPDTLLCFAWGPITPVSRSKKGMLMRARHCTVGSTVVAAADAPAAHVSPARAHHAYPPVSAEAVCGLGAAGGAGCARAIPGMMSMKQRILVAPAFINISFLSFRGSPQCAVCAELHWWRGG